MGNKCREDFPYMEKTAELETLLRQVQLVVIIALPFLIAQQLVLNTALSLPIRPFQLSEVKPGRKWRDFLGLQHTARFSREERAARAARASGLV